MAGSDPHFAGTGAWYAMTHFEPTLPPVELLDALWPLGTALSVEAPCAELAHRPAFDPARRSRAFLNAYDARKTSTA